MPDQDRRQTGLETVSSELLNLLGDLGLDLRCEKISVEHDCRHKVSPDTIRDGTSI